MIGCLYFPTLYAWEIIVLRWYDLMLLAYYNVHAFSVSFVTLFALGLSEYAVSLFRGQETVWISCSLMICEMTYRFSGHLDSFQTSVTYASSPESRVAQHCGHASSAALTTESTSCCHFVASHYSNENTTGRKVTQNGHGWATCQNSFSLSFLRMEAKGLCGV